MVYSQGTKCTSILATRQDKHSLAVTFWKICLYSVDSVDEFQSQIFRYSEQFDYKYIWGSTGLMMALKSYYIISHHFIFNIICGISPHSKTKRAGATQGLLPELRLVLKHRLLGKKHCKM